MEYDELKQLMSLQKEEMTAAERMKAYNAGEEVDYQPYTLQAPDPAMADIFGFTTTQFAKDFEVKSEVIKRRRDEFGLDSFNVGLGLKTIGAALGSELSAPEHGIDYVKHHVLQDYKDFDNLEITDPYTNPVLAPILESAKRLKDRFPDVSMTTSVAGPISTAVAVRPVEKLLRDTRKNPEMVHKLLDLTVACSLKWFEAFHHEFGSVGTNFSDPVTCMDVISKKQFDEFSLPYIKKLIDGTEKIMGSRPGAHICGKTNKIWSDLADAGLFSFSIDNCEDLSVAKEVIGDRMRIAGNVPPVDVMKNGTIDDVIEACKECIIKCADSPAGFILNTGCQLPIGTPKANVEAFIYAAREFGKGARMGHMPKGIEPYL
jgi:uroporphyrinogen decarboxylase